VIELAARNNAEWCDAVCREHGLSPVFDGPLWWCADRTPQFYPDAVTLRPGVSADAVLAHVDGSAGCSVKDSFVDLELDGFDVLFDAQWMVLDEPLPPVEFTVAERRARIAFLEGDGWSAVASRSESVVGISNVAGDYAAAASAVCSVFSGVRVVGYDHGERLAEALAAGFRALGPLRVLMKPG
jgi:hypothetical protein